MLARAGSRSPVGAGRRMERGRLKLTLLYVKQIANGNLLFVSANSGAL